MSLAPFVRILGRGPGRSRALTREEAREAMALILSGRAEPEAVGALLMLLRYRGETAPEVAGLVEALRETLPRWPGAVPALDWPSYAAGRTRGAPWFLLSARLVAMAGVPVLIHGWNSHQSLRASVRAGLDALGLPVSQSIHEAAQRLDSAGLAYLPLEVLSPRALDLLRLRDVLGLRSAINTVLRVLNPAAAPASVQGVFHPPYRELQADAGALLGHPNLTVLKGGGGEFERHPGKAVELLGLRDGSAWEDAAPALSEDTRRLAEDGHGPEALAALWDGTLVDPFAEAVALGTAALALETVGRARAGAGVALAREFWTDRHRAPAA